MFHLCHYDSFGVVNCPVEIDRGERGTPFWNCRSHQCELLWLYSFSFLMDNFSLDLIRYWRFGFLISHWRCWSLFSQSASIGPRPKVKGRTVFRGPNDSMQVAAFKFQLVRGWIQLQVKGEMVCVIGVNEISIFFFFVSYLIINEELNPNRWKIEDKTTLPVRLI